MNCTPLLVQEKIQNGLDGAMAAAMAATPDVVVKDRKLVQV